MSCRGVHFGVPQDVVEKLFSLQNDKALVHFIQEELENEYFGSQGDHLCETDKAWDAIHRCLTDGRLLFDNGDYPLNQCILGGKQLHKGNDYIVSLVDWADVPNVAEAIRYVTKEQLRHKYDAINPHDYGINWSEEGFRYTWDYFESLKPFWARAAEDGRAVLFTVDQ